jgi:murein DD-endopeptidase MepM/ murein hydrolase activator NlpD
MRRSKMALPLFLLRWFAASLPLAIPHAAKAQAPSFDVPVRCKVGSDCFVQNYVDSDPGPGARDFACGRLSYDGHKGTDFRVRDLGEMRRGVTVVAAAPGTVVRVRDGMKDVSIHQNGGPPTGREAGNAVVVDHGGGWETQYSHLRRNSVAVKPGDPVDSGTPLGQIGLSGNTEFPHVDFAVRHEGRVVDPFVGETALPPACPSEKERPETRREDSALWSLSARKVLAYRPSGLLNAGFAPEPPKAETAREGGYGATRLPTDISVLGVWAEFFGGREGDRMTIWVTGPDGRRLHESGGVVPRPLAVLFAAASVPKPGGSWPTGTYTVTITLSHSTDIVVREERSVELEPWRN